MAESEELKNLLMKVKEESEKVGPEHRDLGSLVGGGEQKGFPNLGFIQISQGIRTKRE